MIRMDFRADLRAHIDTRLLELGYVPEAAGVVRAEEAPYLMLLLRALRRMPAATPRQAILAPGFEVPSEHVDGFGALIRAVENGASLRPWLSTLVRKLKKRDELLDDWGIHHFHLGAVPSAKNRDFVARTDEVAFAMVRPDAVYFLVATSHNAQKAPNVWT
ncbi:hypothetical protein L5014_23765 [Paraburkholderia sp. RG36]|uniref:Uncharacterized protein n=2 Tax=Paraburkholderia tagetis TaxID=2913261 RepID=A0A9X1RT03_9BURK|nr:hypothetical protein [Paraburkholderia tagetis]